MNETIDIFEQKKEIEITDYLANDSEIQPSRANEESLEEKFTEKRSKGEKRGSLKVPTASVLHNMDRGTSPVFSPA